jgi:hypothetical protein
MLFTWDTQNLCIVFKSWRVTSTMSLLWSLLGVMLLTAGYELIREISRRYEAKVQREIDDMPSKFPPLLPSTSNFSAVIHFCFVARFGEINIAKMGMNLLQKTTKKKAHCSHQDARLPTRMRRPKPSRLLCMPSKCFIRFSSCKSLFHSRPPFPFHLASLEPGRLVLCSKEIWRLTKIGCSS